MGEKTPALTVVIASVNGAEAIGRCLAHLANQKGDVETEVVVAGVTGDATASFIRTKHPSVKLLTYSERRTIPQLRAAGLAASHGDIVAIIEDHCNPRPDWRQEVVSTHRAHPDCVAVGGAVENGRRDRLVDWAVFFCEYAAYMLPLERGPSNDIPGSNSSYKRRAFEGVDDLAETLERGFWESTLHPRLVACGERFFLEPSIIVDHDKRFGVRYFLAQRYHYSRYYAGTLSKDWSLPKRLFRSLSSPGLLPLLSARILGQVVRKRRYLRELFLASPLLFLFVIAWSAGEAVGCLLGPGDSLVRIE